MKPSSFRSPLANTGAEETDRHGTNSHNGHRVFGMAREHFCRPAVLQDDHFVYIVWGPQLGNMMETLHGGFGNGTGGFYLGNLGTITDFPARRV